METPGVSDAVPDLELIRRFRGEGADAEAQNSAGNLLKERYDARLLAYVRAHTTGKKTEARRLVNDVWTAVFRGGESDLPDGSILGWLQSKALSQARDEQRSDGRRRRLAERAAKRVGTVDGRIQGTERRKTPRIRRARTLSPAPCAPLWLLPTWLEEMVKACAPSDKVLTWWEVNAAPSCLRDMLSYDPVILGPASDAGGTHPLSRFPAAWHAIAEALAVGGRSVIALLPAIGMTRSRGDGDQDALHNQSVHQLRMIGPQIVIHPARFAAQVTDGAVDLGEQWNHALDDWLKRHDPNNPPTDSADRSRSFSLPQGRADGAFEFDLAPGPWHLRPLRHYGDSPRAVAGLALGPGRVLVLPYVQPFDRQDVLTLRSLATLLNSLPAVVPLHVQFDASNDFDNNTFTAATGIAWHLEPKLAAVVWAYLEERQPTADEVSNLAIKRRLCEINRFGAKDQVRRLVNSINDDFDAFCAETLRVRPYHLFVNLEAGIRLQFPDQFVKIDGRAWARSERVKDVGSTAKAAAVDAGDAPAPDEGDAKPSSAVEVAGSRAPRKKQGPADRP